MTLSVVDYMAQPTTMFEPADPAPLRTVNLTPDEFNAAVVRSGKPIEYVGVDHAQVVVGPVRYVTSIVEVAC